MSDRLALTLLLALVLASLQLVHVRHEVRRLYSALEVAHKDQKRLDDEAVGLQARLTTESSAMAAERGAEKLGMQVATPAVTLFVQPPPPRAVPGGAR